MDKKTLEALDYYRIRSAISRFCESEEGRALILSREPFSRADDFLPQKKLGREWLKCLSSEGGVSIKSFPPVEEAIFALNAKGGFLSLEQIFALGTFCVSSRSAKQDIGAMQNKFNLRALPSLAEKMPPLADAENEIFKVIEKDGALRDLKELREIKSAIAEIRREIENAFKRIASDASLSQVLESNIPVVRAEREVLAVKSSERAKISGIVHEVSNTGRTVFIEPEEAVRLNNDLLQKEFEYEQAVWKILIQLTEKISVYKEDFIDALKTMSVLDAALAAARWGQKNACSFAGDVVVSESAGEKGGAFLQGARHPVLIEKLGIENTIPIDINFSNEKKVIIITGPNTGGKTVAIKTFALAALLNQSAFPVPASSESRLPCFDAVFADIGDEQSLDDSLSTFSAHIKNIARAVQNATEKSLVLLDELGSGTDPQEGAAIAMAVLDELLERKSFVLVTTHQGALKNYGWTNPLCENASVEFDSATMRPSYKIAMGIPGESHALEIAAAEAEKQNAFSPVVARAKNYIASQKADVSELIKGLNQKHAELDLLIAEHKLTKQKIDEHALKAEEKVLQLRRREHDLKIAESKEESRFLRQTRKRLENLVRELREGEITREKTQRVRAFISDLEASEKIHSSHLEAEEKNLARDEERHENKANNAAKSDGQKFYEGAAVALKSGGKQGTILRREKDGLWTVQFASIKMPVEESKMRLLSASANEKLVPSISYDLLDKKDNSAQYDVFPENKPLFELRLLGMRRDEALKILEKQIDLCIIHGLNSFSVIHGKGTGALQQAVQDYLSHCIAISEFSFADANDGGFGKTYVKLG